jgi:hypothetical protein
MPVIIAFLVSCTALLALSWLLALTPGLTWRGKVPGVPVKDTTVQSMMFTLCIAVLADVALDAWRSGRRGVALALAALAGLFLANLVFVATGRVPLAILVLLLMLWAIRRMDWKGIAAAAAVGATLALVLWMTSPYLQKRIDALFEAPALNTSTGQRLEFWRQSADVISAAPLIGHGTGAISGRLHAVRLPDGRMLKIDNPHNQTFAVAIQLGLAGVAVLYAMWVAHLWLFRHRGLACWIGMVVVVQNILGSIVNSHLFDFTPGWLYVIGVGIMGGMALRRTEAAIVPPDGAAAEPATRSPRSATV